MTAAGGLPFLAAPPRHLFFTGKGGVGKTSLACASAVELADNGRRVLIVSTDPASNLDTVLTVRLGSAPTEVPGVPGLLGMNIDPEVAAHAYRERALAPYRGALPDDELARMEEQLRGACTVEVAAFDEFAALLGPESAADIDHIVFDTAPSGHTLRLLQLPAAWTAFLATSTTGASCLGPLAGLKTQQSRYQEAMTALADRRRTIVVLVARPEWVALLEAERTRSELAALGITNQHLVINGVFRAADRTDPLALAVETRAGEALARVPAGLATLPSAEVPLRGYNVVGLAAVRDFLRGAQRDVAPPDGRRDWRDELAGVWTLARLADELAGEQGLVMVIGKGGVGKTTIAAAIAVELAGRGARVHLATTDPAEHLAETLQADVPGLRVSRIDPTAEARRYREQALATRGAGLDAAARAVLEEELRSPCYDELAVFQAFSRIVIGARRELIILDTAPTGHTVLLLETAEIYHRKMVEGRSPEGSARIVTPLMLLRNPHHTKVLIVTLPETTPVLEAAALQGDLRRAGIEPFAWVINASLAAARPRDPILVQRAAAEGAQIRRVCAEFAQRAALVPFQTEEPVGPVRLRRLARVGEQTDAR
jgi:arsenite-transporting ATPase